MCCEVQICFKLMVYYKYIVDSVFKEILVNRNSTFRLKIAVFLGQTSYFLKSIIFI